MWTQSVAIVISELEVLQGTLCVFVCKQIIAFIFGN